MSSIGLGENSFDVRQGLANLAGHVTLVNGVAVRVEGHLSGPVGIMGAAMAVRADTVERPSLRFTVDSGT